MSKYKTVNVSPETLEALKALKKHIDIPSLDKVIDMIVRNWICKTIGEINQILINEELSSEMMKNFRENKRKLNKILKEFYGFTYEDYEKAIFDIRFNIRTEANEQD